MPGAEEAQAMARRVVDTVLRGLWEIEPLGISARFCRGQA